MSFFLQFIYSFFGTTGFAIYFNAPLDSIIPSGIAGGISWSLYNIIFSISDNIILATFMGAFLVGSIGEILAIKYKKPATVFITPGIIPLVPGSGMYYTMNYLVNNDFNGAISEAIEVLIIAAAIALGIMLSTIFSQTFRQVRNRLKIKRN